MDTQLLLPKGITMNKTKSSFRIQTRKKVMIDGKKDSLKDFGTIKINYQPNMTAADKLKTFNVALEEDKMEEMIKKSNGKRTIPQIFIEDYHVGGYVELRSLEVEGKLNNLLK